MITVQVRHTCRQILIADDCSSGRVHLAVRFVALTVYLPVAFDYYSLVVHYCCIMVFSLVQSQKLIIPIELVYIFE